MGYNKSKRSIERVREIFKLVTQLRNEPRITVPTKTPTKLSQTIFDAFKAIEVLADDNDDKQFSWIKQDYRVRVKEGGIVFELRSPVEYENPILELAKSKVQESYMTLTGITTPIQVVGACIKHKCTITFPDLDVITMSAEALAQLKKWADKSDYTFKEENPLTMIKYERPEASRTQVDRLEQG